jgi:hypothetical protein
MEKLLVRNFANFLLNITNEYIQDKKKETRKAEGGKTPLCLFVSGL